MMRLALALCFLPSLAIADVTLSVSGCNTNLECSFSLTGDAGPVTLNASSGAFDWVANSSGASIVTTPLLGGNNENPPVASPSVTFNGPMSGRFDIDGPSAFPPATLTVGGRSAPIVASGSTWTATVVTGAAPPPPPPPPEFRTVEWALPTQWDDGTPLLPGELVASVVEYGTCPTAGVWGSALGQIVVPLPSVSTQIPYVSAQTCARVKVRTFDGIESDWSNVLRDGEVYAPPPPPPPPPP